MAAHHHERELATAYTAQNTKRSQVDSQCELRQVAGTLGYSDPLYTRSGKSAGFVSSCRLP